MQGAKFIHVRLLKVDVHTLTLIYVASTVNGHINHYFLLNLPDSPEKEIHLVRKKCRNNKEWLVIYIQMNTYL